MNPVSVNVPKKKISPIDYLLFMCQESITGTVSYNDLAAKISSEKEIDATRQAYFYRTKEETVVFFKKILAAVMRHKHHINTEKVSLKNHYKRILIQDSTIVRLPSKLYEIFSGVKNAAVTVCNARIQGVYDLLSGNFISFSIDPYSKNDLKAASEIEVQEGDLVLRDRGYFITTCFDEMKSKGADSISRYKHKCFFYHPDTYQKIDLSKKLKHTKFLDMTVLSAPNAKTKLRIIAVPAPDNVANTRRREAQKEAKHRGSVCSDELLQLLGWTIFITTITDPEFTIKQAIGLYSMRWRIECIFKTWKSNFNFDKIHSVSEIQLKVLLYARFIFITSLFERLYTPLEEIVLVRTHKILSLMKFMRFITKNLHTFIKQFFDSEKKDAAIKRAIKYCTFDKRKRTNFNQAFADI